MKKPELLAPAGNTDAFHAAIGAGADAVYLGLDGCFNARMRAKNFSMRDLCSLVPYAHSRGVKIYVTLNTLIKQADIKQALDALYRLDQIGVDAVIIADIGLMKLVFENFPSLRVHGSTQAAVHNSYGAEFLKTLGVRRVVLARELSLDEISETAKNSPIETEVFIHGALCYSVSGLCLASSFIGGASGNRGKCAQVCRRRFECRDGKGYFFSPRDLQTVTHINGLINSGVSCFKIEGRMKGAEYVSAVVRAYRRAIDHPDDIDSLSRSAGDLRFDFGREKTAYYIEGRRDKTPIDPSRPSGTGIFIGTIIERGEASFTLPAKFLEDGLTITPGDRLRVQPENGFEGTTCKIAKCKVSNDKIVISVTPPIQYNIGDHTFLIAGRSPARIEGNCPVSGTLSLNVGDDGVRALHATPLQNGRTRNARPYDTLGFDFRIHKAVQPHGGRYGGRSPLSPKKDFKEFDFDFDFKDFGVRGFGKSPKTSPKPRLWFKADSLNWLPILSATPCQNLIFDADVSGIENLLDDPATVKTWRSRVSIALPPFIEEPRLRFWRGVVKRCLAAGLRSFTVSNAGHLPLVDGASDITADALLWCVNSFTQRELLSRGISRFVFSYEDDFLNIRNSTNAVGYGGGGGGGYSTNKVGYNSKGDDRYSTNQVGYNSKVNDKYHTNKVEYDSKGNNKYPTNKVGYDNKRQDKNHTNIVGIVPIYAKPPLFVSRMPPAVDCGTTMADPHGNKFSVTIKNGLYYTFPETPVCLFAKREKLSQCGIADFLIDVSFHNPTHESAISLVKGFKDNIKIPGSSIFNFKAGLH